MADVRVGTLPGGTKVTGSPALIDRLAGKPETKKAPVKKAAAKPDNKQ